MPLLFLLYNRIMDFTDFSSVFEWVIAHGYILMFVVMFIEGPMVTAAAAFAAALGYFNIGIVVLLSMTAEVSCDLSFYALGYWGRETVLQRVAHRLGLTDARVKRIEQSLRLHRMKTMIAIKLTPIIPLAGLVLIGYTRMPLSTFVRSGLSVTIPSVAIFATIGYYFGSVYESVSTYIQNGMSAIGIGIILLFLVYLLYRKVAERIGRQIKKL